MKKLLITMGDSWTFGHGSYVPELEEKYSKGEISNDDLFYGSINNFFNKSWPNQFAAHFNFELLNLARPGGSNSGQVKRLIGPIIKNKLNDDDFFYKYANDHKDKSNPILINKKIDEINLSEYDKITLIWILSYPQRFSFFRNGVVKDILPGKGMYSDEREFGESYIKYIDDDRDYILETIFYLKLVDMFCNLNNINFLYGSISNDYLKYYSYFYKKNGCLNILENGEIIHYPNKINKEFSFCGHPNENGYKILANQLIEVIGSRYQHAI